VVTIFSMYYLLPLNLESTDRFGGKKRDELVKSQCTFSPALPVARLKQLIDLAVIPHTRAGTPVRQLFLESRNSLRHPQNSKLCWPTDS
jgi:hypothetical protein